jgi:predicted permease
VRVQLLAAAVALSITSVWRLQGVAELLWPLFVALSFATLLLVALWTTRGPRRPGRAALQTWSATANTGYFVVPVAAALAGPAGVVLAVVTDRVCSPVWATYIALMRHSAPIPQRRRTGLIDQSPLLAVGVGLLLRLTGPPPDWTADVTLWLAPLMAALGAAMYVGSVLHPTQRIDPAPGVRRWVALAAVRAALLLPLAALAPTRPLMLVCLLCGLSIPAFGPAQMSTVYGYAEPAVAAANRYGWLVGAAGLAAAVLLTR